MRLVFMDTETTGLGRDADVWDFAAIERTPVGDVQHQFYIEHDENKARSLPEPFLSDYLARYRNGISWAEASARIAEIFEGKAHVVGAVPSFDTIRLARMLDACGYGEPWHYHLIDVEAVAVGALGVLPDLPWDSDALSKMFGVQAPEKDRHTAIGDARWVRDLFDAALRGTK